MKPDLKELNQFETALLLNIMILLNGKLLNGTEEEKEEAREEIKKYQHKIYKITNYDAFVKAVDELRLDKSAVDIFAGKKKEQGSCME